MSRERKKDKYFVQKRDTISFDAIPTLYLSSFGGRSIIIGGNIDTFALARNRGSYCLRHFIAWQQSVGRVLLPLLRLCIRGDYAIAFDPRAECTLRTQLGK